MSFDPRDYLGYVTREERTPEQEAAHEVALACFMKHDLPEVTLSKGEKFCLFDFWKHPDVVADVGFVFDRFRQLTGSCVGVGGGCGLFSTICAQRLDKDNPTKAFLPFWLAPYGMSRHYGGMDGQGSGSFGSTFVKALTQDGITDWPNGQDEHDLPDYDHKDGIAVSSNTELQWSSYRHRGLQDLLPVTREHRLGAGTKANDVESIRRLVLNGYGVTVACSRFIGNGRVRGSGANAYVEGSWDSSGGHQQSIHAVWEHPDDGPLYWAQNTWPKSVYPRDPAGGPVCGVWVTERNLERVFSYGDEIYGLSEQDWFPARPSLREWIF